MQLLYPFWHCELGIFITWRLDLDSSVFTSFGLSLPHGYEFVDFVFPSFNGQCEPIMLPEAQVFELTMEIILVSFGGIIILVFTSWLESHFGFLGFTVGYTGGIPAPSRKTHQSTTLYSRDDVNGALKLQQTIIDKVRDQWKPSTPMGRGGQAPILEPVFTIEKFLKPMPGS